MNVLQLFTTTNPEDVVKEHNAFYEDSETDLETYNEFVSILRSKVLVQTDGTIIINHYKKEYDDEELNTESFDVLWLSDMEYSMSFRPWNEIAAAPFKDNTGYLNNAQIAAHLFYEITWHGFEEETEQKFDNLLDLKEKFDRAMDDSDSSIETGVVNGDTICQGLKKVNLADLGLSNVSEEERENRQKRSKYIWDMLRTERVYKNGVLISDRSTNSDDI